MVSVAEQRKLNARQQSAICFRLLTLSHESWTADLRYVNNHTDKTSNSVLYEATEFVWQRPSEGLGQPVGHLSIFNYNSTLGVLLDKAVTPINVQMALVFSDAMDTQIEDWPFQEWRDVRWSAREATGNLVFPDYDSEMWPPRTATNVDFPGMVW